MTPLEFDTLRSSMGFTHATLAEYFQVSLRTAQRWCATQEPPVRVSSELLAMWGDWADRIGEIIEIAEKMDGEPVPLLAYQDELECQTYTGLNLSQHKAFLGHVCMTLTAEDHAWEIQHKP